jgi:hypothetical protein
MKYSPIHTVGDSLCEIMTKGKIIDLMNTNGIFYPCGLKICYVVYDKIKFKSHTSL